MYRKIYKLRSQFEHGEIDAEKASLLLGSIFEQADAEGNMDAVILTGMADEWIEKHDWKKYNNLPDEARKQIFIKIAKDLRDGTLLDDLELLAWSLAEKDAQKIEQYMVEKHGKDGYTFDNIENYRDNDIMTEHFTAQGNVFIWFKDWWGEEGQPDGIINEVGFLGANGKPKVIDFSDKLGISNDHGGQLKAIMAELEKRGM